MSPFLEEANLVGVRHVERDVILDLEESERLRACDPLEEFTAWVFLVGVDSLLENTVVTIGDGTGGLCKGQEPKG